MPGAFKGRLQPRTGAAPGAQATSPGAWYNCKQFRRNSTNLPYSNRLVVGIELARHTCFLTLQKTRQSALFRQRPPFGALLIIGFWTEQLGVQQFRLLCSAAHARGPWGSLSTFESRNAWAQS